mmetsp:Transcript_21993/g.30795  ORF Transcript_21993/g.30795 Transcript_21993/m.30795 type:complete len:218 (-) Transcript_21993:143-796(-)
MFPILSRRLGRSNVIWLSADTRRRTSLLPSNLASLTSRSLLSLKRQTLMSLFPLSLPSWMLLLARRLNTSTPVSSRRRTSTVSALCTCSRRKDPPSTGTHVRALVLWLALTLEHAFVTTTRCLVRSTLTSLRLMEFSEKPRSSSSSRNASRILTRSTSESLLSRCLRTRLPLVPVMDPVLYRPSLLLKCVNLTRDSLDVPSRFQSGDFSSMIIRSSR